MPKDDPSSSKSETAQYLLQLLPPTTICKVPGPVCYFLCSWTVVISHYW